MTRRRHEPNNTQQRRPFDYGGGDTLMRSLGEYFTFDSLNGLFGGIELTNNNGALFNGGIRGGTAINLSSAHEQYLSAPQAETTQLEPAGDFTISCWARSANIVETPDSMTVISKNNDANTGWQIYCSKVSGVVNTTAHMGTSKIGSVVNNGGFVENQWNFICMRHRSNVSGDNTFLNVNADPVVSGVRSLTGEAFGDFYIGAEFATVTNYWSGSIDELGYWNRYLDDQEVARLFNNGLGRTIPFHT